MAFAAAKLGASRNIAEQKAGDLLESSLLLTHSAQRFICQ